jgi:hypothetical protein
MPDGPLGDRTPPVTALSRVAQNNVCERNKVPRVYIPVAISAEVRFSWEGWPPCSPKNYLVQITGEKWDERDGFPPIKMNGSAGQSRFPAASERLHSFVLGEAQTIVLLGGNAIIVFRLLPTLAGLVFKERRLASLRAVMVETIELYGEFRWT